LSAVPFSQQHSLRHCADERLLEQMEQTLTGGLLVFPSGIVPCIQFQKYVPG
jgi:hypothetical protein